MALALTLLNSQPLSAATLQFQTLEELGRAADLIVHGTVRTLRTGSEPLTTKVVLLVHQSWKHKATSPLTLVLPVGSHNGITAAVPGIASFRAGEEVLIFLTHNPAGHYEILHGKQGKFTIETTSRGNQILQQESGGQLDLLETMAHLSLLFPVNIN